MEIIKIKKIVFKADIFNKVDKYPKKALIKQKIMVV